MNFIAVSLPAGLPFGTFHMPEVTMPSCHSQAMSPPMSRVSRLARVCQILPITTSPVRNSSWLCEPEPQATTSFLISFSLLMARFRSIG